mmetsp:Transcript_31841/g.75605  ORF Transcript_31841/g.75605 Transcript_31841/m.75605 type:complete len:647 (+) Transcript_31841:394-2334(+)
MDRFVEQAADENPLILQSLDNSVTSGERSGWPAGGRGMPTSIITRAASRPDDNANGTLVTDSTNFSSGAHIQNTTPSLAQETPFSLQGQQHSRDSGESQHVGALRGAELLVSASLPTNAAHGPSVRPTGIGTVRGATEHNSLRGYRRFMRKAAAAWVSVLVGSGAVVAASLSLPLLLNSRWSMFLPLLVELFIMGAALSWLLSKLLSTYDYRQSRMYICTVLLVGLTAAAVLLAYGLMEAVGSMIRLGAGLLTGLLFAALLTLAAWIRTAHLVVGSRLRLGMLPATPHRAPSEAVHPQSAHVVNIQCCGWLAHGIPCAWSDGAQRGRLLEGGRPPSDGGRSLTAAVYLKFIVMNLCAEDPLRRSLRPEAHQTQPRRSRSFRGGHQRSAQQQQHHHHHHHHHEEEAESQRSSLNTSDTPGRRASARAPRPASGTSKSSTPGSAPRLPRSMATTPRSSLAGGAPGSSRPGAREPSMDVPWQDPDARAELLRVYNAFASFGSSHAKMAEPASAEALEMENKQFVKLVKDAGLTGGELNVTRLDIIFSKVKAKGRRKINFPGFERALAMLAGERRLALSQIYNSIVSTAGPQLNHVTTPEFVKYHDDKNTYTGVYARGGPSNTDERITLDRMVVRNDDIYHFSRTPRFVA